MLRPEAVSTCSAKIKKRLRTANIPVVNFADMLKFRYCFNAKPPNSIKSLPLMAA
jgi:hypothetical protein